MLSKSELALTYFPQSNPSDAVRTLMKMVDYCKELHQALLATGYKKTQRFFTPKQISLIYAYLGEP